MYNIRSLQAIIFDFGGVIINIDYQKTIDAFSHLGISNFHEVFSKAQQNILSDNFEKGLISQTQFFEELRAKCNPNTPLHKVSQAWNAMILDIPQHRLDFLMKIKALIPTFLLSNTNECHIEHINKWILPQHQAVTMGPWFSKVYYSYLMGQRKPDDEIFFSVIHENELNPTEVLFIDDSPQHIFTAQKLGFQTHHLKHGEDITQLLNCSYI